MNNRKKVTIISLDYDECADILFDDIVESHESDKELASDLAYNLAKLAACKNIVMNLLDHILVDSSTVELYVGSARQDICADEICSKKNFNNGLCFQNYAVLCQQKNWTFRKLLLGDAQEHRPVGSTMHNRNLCSVNDTTSKAALIQAQLNDVEKNYADEDVDIDFYFLDDDYKNIYHNELATIYSTKPLPASIRNFSLIKLDWYDHYGATNGIYCGTLVFHTHISQFPDKTVEVVRSEKNCWNQFISFPPMIPPEKDSRASVAMSLAIFPPLKAKKVAIISLDYDGCADILFDEIIKLYQPDEKFIKTIDIPLAKLTTSKNTLRNLLDHISSHADIVELYVGSNRQDIFTDEHAARLRKTGSCFQNFTHLCQQKNWTFRKFLQGDAQIDLPVGTTMRNKNVFSRVTSSKTGLIQAQLKDVEKNYCDAEVNIDFYFIDDDGKNIIHKELADIHSQKLPFDKIKNFSLIKFDCHLYLHTYKTSSGILNFHTRISQSPDKTLQIIRSEENNWNTFNPGQTCDAIHTQTDSSSTATILSAMTNSGTHDNSSLVFETTDTTMHMSPVENKLDNDVQPSLAGHEEDCSKIRFSS